MGFFDKFKRKIETPLEVIQTREEIITFLDNNNNFATDLIKKEALVYADMTEQTVHTIRIDKMQPDELALILITNVIGIAIPSGNYHNYRGILNLQGSDMEKIWKLTVNKLYERGYYTKEKVDEDLEWLAKEIRIAG